MSQKDNLFYKNGYKDPGVYTWGVRGGGGKGMGWLCPQALLVVS